jgi:Ca2+-binding RTX toxin-like protein
MLVASAVSVAAAAAPAQAWNTGWVSVDSNHHLSFDAAPSTPNRVKLAPGTNGVVLSDSVAPVTLVAGHAPGCTQVDDHTVHCANPIHFAWVRLDDGDDKFTNSVSMQLSAEGGSGDDELSSTGTERVYLSGDGGKDKLYGGSGPDVLGGGTESDILFGGDGDDELWDGPGWDYVRGQLGNDWLRSGLGRDDLDGGDGDKDVVAYYERNGVTVSLDELNNDGVNGEEDNVRSSVEVVVGSAGNDTLRGNDADNELQGEGGSDMLYGKGGNDLLDVGYGSNQTVDGGAGMYDVCLGYNITHQQFCEGPPPSDD